MPHQGQISLQLSQEKWEEQTKQEEQEDQEQHEELGELIYVHMFRSSWFGPGPNPGPL